MGIVREWYSGDGFYARRRSQTDRPIGSGSTQKLRIYRAGMSGEISTAPELSSDLSTATVRNPISNADMWAFIGATYGGTSNFVRTSVVDVGGSRGKVLNQHFTAGQYSTGDGIALTGVPLDQAYDEATISYDFRFLSAGTPWGWGGKLPGLGGIRPGTATNPPTGGSPTPNGWSGRNMWVTKGSYSTALDPAELIGYPYLPYQGSGEFGFNRYTRRALAKDTWYRTTIYYKMNTVTTEGSTTPPANGIHRIFLDGVQCFEKLDERFRFYTNGNITHMVWDNFFGGGTVDWAPTADVDIQFDNLVIEGLA